MIGDRHRRRATRIRNWNHDIDVVVRPFAHNLAGQLLTHSQPRFVNGQVVDDRIRSCEIHEFENAGRITGCAGILATVQDALVLDEHRLARTNVAQLFELQQIERHALGGNHVFGAAIRFTTTDNNRPDAVRVAEGNNAMSDDHCHHGVTTGTTFVNSCNGVKNLIGRRPAIGPDLQFVRKHIQQHFRIRTRIQVPAILPCQEIGKASIVSQVAVVRETNTVRGIDVKGLRFRRLGAPCGRVTNVSHADIAGQAQHVARMEYVANQAVALADTKAVFTPGNDARRVLPAVLQDSQRVVDRLVNRFFSNYSDNAAHFLILE